MGEDVSSGKPCLIIKDESVASWRGSFLSHPCAFSETVEQLGRPRLYRGQKVTVTRTSIMKSVSSLSPPPPFPPLLREFAQWFDLQRRFLHSTPTTELVPDVAQLSPSVPGVIGPGARIPALHSVQACAPRPPSPLCLAAIA